ncbi:MAG: TlpA family protein disulfide reductase [Acidobacteria bacterium]|nr:TlpA family protein disulfide reductase [Acidobacteriota bacterium]MCA1608567.1 TlpA family protein disulfide reductase [Acidobacteriota bacterium]
MRIQFINAVGLTLLCLSVTATAQKKQIGSTTPNATASPIVVTQIDDASFKKLLVPNGKPLLINFWATWCDPCREEFPELVEIDKHYKGKIDFVTVSLDDPADLKTTVPHFLRSMKAEMPAYLLKSADESTLITAVAKDWNGGLPFTILYDRSGSLAYFRQGKVIPAVLREKIDPLVSRPIEPVMQKPARK